MDGVRKPVLFLEVAGIMLHSGLFSELVVDVEALAFPLDGPALSFVFVFVGVF